MLQIHLLSRETDRNQEKSRKKFFKVCGNPAFSIIPLLMEIQVLDCFIMVQLRLKQIGILVFTLQFGN